MSDPRAIGHKGSAVMLDADVLTPIVKQLESAKEARAAALPDEYEALRVLFAVFERLQELGWKAPIYAPRDRRPLEIIEFGSTGVHLGYRDEEGGFWVVTDGDDWPSCPLMTRELSAAEAAEKVEVGG